MLAQSLKDVYYFANRWLVLPNTLLARVSYRGRRGLYLHLGSGDDYRDGLINVDGNILRRKDLWLDLRNRLPFADRSVALIYCSHTLEHLYPEDAQALLKEMHRVLADDGIVRLAVPSFEKALDIVAGKDASHWPRDFEDRRSQAINYLFCDGQHRYAYCFENLRDFARQAGFPEVVNYSRNHGVEEKRYGQVTLGNEPGGSLIVELLNREVDEVQQKGEVEVGAAVQQSGWSSV